MATYDSAKTRIVAREMALLLQTLEADVEGGLCGIRFPMAELRGITAQAMEERLEDMLRLERSLRGGLEDLAQQIDAYADSLERADSWLAEQL